MSIEGLGVKRPIVLKVEDLKKKFKEVSVDSVIQCGGNRRADMNRYKKVQGLMWEGTAIGSAKWTGVRLRVSFFVSYYVTKSFSLSRKTMLSKAQRLLKCDKRAPVDIDMREIRRV